MNFFNREWINLFTSTFGKVQTCDVIMFEVNLGHFAKCQAGWTFAKWSRLDILSSVKVGHLPNGQALQFYIFCQLDSFFFQLVSQPCNLFSSSDSHIKQCRERKIGRKRTQKEKEEENDTTRKNELEFTGYSYRETGSWEYPPPCSIHKRCC